MLKLFLPLSLLLLSSNWQNRKYQWTSTVLSLSLMTLLSLSLFNIYSFDTHMCLSFNMNILSTTLVTLTLWVTSLMYMSSFKIMINKNNSTKFHILVTSLCYILIISFLSSNLFMFYIMFEASLIPTLLLILGWGYQPERLQAGTYLMMYTVTASLPLLASILFINKTSGHMCLTIPFSDMISSSSSMSFWWTVTIAAFMVKTPMYLTHLWLPKAHVEAPVAGSMVLAGMLLKLGSYGFIRVSQSYMFLNLKVAPIFSSISLIGAIIAGAICSRQTDIKSLIAYSSVSHMGLVTAGILSNTIWGWYGSLAMMLAHGLCSSCMFSLANMTYESTNSRSTYITKGLLMMFPALSMWWFLLSACNMAAPPAINLMAEIMLITSIMSAYHMNAMLIAPISFIAAVYSLILYTSTNHGASLNFSNPLLLFIQRNYTTCLLHLIPIITLISCPNLILCFQ